MKQFRRADRLGHVQRFRILYFRDSVLAEAEEFAHGDLLDAIERASSKSPEMLAEVWSERGKVGVIGPSPVAQAGLARRA